MDIVHLLPDSVANQIAAGEVIQRPASVVKELVENSIDAGATVVNVSVKMAGRLAIQVVDNGKGMSPTDARMAFERHATSKIRVADDLFSLATKGFRGEALASIVAVAQVEMRTYDGEAALGTLIELAGSQVERQEMVQCPRGTNFIVKNLFYNVPARRKFLKKDETELRNIIQEMHRIVLTHPDVAFTLHSDNDLIFDLPKGSLKQRIVDVFGRKSRTIDSQLVAVNADSSIVKISGFVGTPQGAGKNTPQFFFVNNRFMYHPYFRRAVLAAYENMVKADDVPMFFLSLDVDPQTIDVNIHPTKTEIKFENEREIWQLIVVAIKESLGKFNITPSLDFDVDDRIDIPVARGCGRSMPSAPRVSFDKNYNPFSEYSSAPKQEVRNWQQLFVESGRAASHTDVRQGSLFNGDAEQKPGGDLLHDLSAPVELSGNGVSANADSMSRETVFHAQRWIGLSLNSGFVVVDVRRAMNRVYYDDILAMVRNNSTVSQKLLFPEVVELSADDACLFTEIEMELAAVGFEISPFGKNMYRIEALPAMLAENINVAQVVDTMLNNIKHSGADAKDIIYELIADSIASSASQRLGAVMSQQERSSILARLFSSSNPNFTPKGEKIIVTLDDNYMTSIFN